MPNKDPIIRKKYRSNYYLKNKKQINDQNKQRHKENLQERKIKQKEYREKNKSKKQDYNKKYYFENHDKINRQNRSRYQKNKEKYSKISKIYQKKWEKTNRDKINKNNLKKIDKLARPLNMTSHQYKHCVQSWSELVRSKHSTCKICGNKADVSHHIIFKAHQPELSLNLHNGIPLCNSCHYEIHRLNNY